MYFYSFLTFIFVWFSEEKNLAFHVSILFGLIELFHLENQYLREKIGCDFCVALNCSLWSNAKL